MSKPLVSLIAVLGCIVLVASGADAVQSKCSSMKFKGTGKKAFKRANCYAKAVRKNEGVDTDCLTKVSDKFSDGFDKAESKGDCLSMDGDAPGIETEVDTFVDQVRTTVNNQAGGPSKCDAKKIKFTGKKAYAKAKCYAKALSRNLPLDGTCISKAEEKFGLKIASAEAGDDCTNTGQTSSLEMNVDDFIADIVADLMPPPTTTTTSTTLPFIGLSFTTSNATSNCGTAGLTSPPSAPFSGEIDSDTAGTVKISDLGLGCLYIGGGAAVGIPPGGVPSGSTSHFSVSGGTTLGPSSGTSLKNCTEGAGPGKHCINNDAQPACSMDLNCGGSAGSCALDANCYFGPPLDIAAGSLSTCVINAIQNDASGTVNLPTGDASISLMLSSRVYITGNNSAPCPKCLSGVCDPTWKTNVASVSPNTGDPCTPVGAGQTSLDCLPPFAGFQAPLPVNLSPLTTYPSITTSASGLFCPGQVNAGAFGQAATRAIKQNGSPGGDLTDEQPHNAVLGYSFCIPATNNLAVDGLADIPGPGSVGLNGNMLFASPSGAFVSP